MNTFNLTLDLNKSRASSPVRLRQGDKSGTTIAALILDHGATADLTGMTAQLVMELPDGTQYYRKAASISGNSVSVLVDEAQAASVSGRTANAYFQMLQGTTVKASTGSFVVEILPDALEGHTVPESYDSAIQDAIDALDAAVADMPDTVEDVLADHPEWTTTVQDGSITASKLATDLARDRERLMYRLANMLTNALPEGETAAATDAAKTPLAGLSLYGRSTQDGTPTPSAPVAIQSVTPNLAKGYAATATNNGITYVTTEGGATTISGTASGGSAMPLQSAGTFALPAGTYTLVMGGELTASGTGARAQLVKVTGSSISNVNATPYTTGGGTVYVTFTTTEDMTAFVRIGVNSGSVVSGTLQFALYEGSVACPAVPYGHVGLWAKRTSDASTATVTPIDLDGHELRSLPDGTRDELTVGADGRVTLVQRVGAADMGALSYTRITNGSVYLFDAQITDARYTDNAANLMCSDYEAANTIGYGLSDKQCTRATSSREFYFRNDAYADAAAFKAASSGATVTYRLAEPVTIDLGWTDAIPLCGPDLTAQAVPSAPFALTYERDLNATLARLESALATLV